MRHTISIHEIFQSIQGESNHTGRTTTFVRSVGCNLSCSYCDTGYKPEDDRRLIPRENYTKSELLQRLLLLDSPYICFTGGEPLLYQEFIYDVIETHLEKKNKDTQGTWVDGTPIPRYTIETNGTILIENNAWWRADNSIGIVMDIKPFSLKQYYDIVKKNLSNLSSHHDEVKVVITAQEDLDLMTDIIEEYPHLSYILSPVHDGTKFTTGQMICDFVVEKRLPNVRVGIQIHKLLGQR